MANESYAQMSSQINAWSGELEAFIEEVRQRTIRMVLPGLFIGAILLGVSVAPNESQVNTDRQLFTALLIFFLTALVWWLRQRFYPVAAWLLVLGSAAILIFVATWEEMAVAVVLLVLPIGMATLLISRLAGGIVALACSAFIFLAPPDLLPAALVTRSMAVVGVWSVFGLLVSALYPLISATSWAWSGYERSSIFLHQAREYQQQYLAVLKDLKDANAQLIRLNKHAQGLRLLAEEERHIKEQFVANVSHELRTPLNMIIGFSEMILNAPENYSWDLPPKLLADLDVIQRNSQHLSELVDDVLDLSQIEAGRMALTKEFVALTEIVNAAVLAVRPLFEPKRLFLNVDVPGDLPLIFCDRTRIREVMLNLLSNAGRFTDMGGVHVKAWQEGRDVIVSVQDTGTGIAAEDHARLFQPFRQLDNSIRRRHQGTGLGLSLSKNFVELHEGKMWIESKKGEGTTVFFRLPIEPHEAIPAGAASKLIPGWEFLQRTHVPQLPVAAPTNPRIVVVESGKSLCALLERHLSGVEVVAASDLQQAVQDLASTPAQAIIFNHVEVSQGLEMLNALPDLPIGIPALVCNMPEAGDAANRVGANEYLVKPISRNALLNALHRLGPGIKTVLVADDEPDALQLFRRMLTGAGLGYRVLRAADGQQALDIMRSEPVDVLLLDLMMPEMNGYQVLAAREQDSALARIPVILISARDPWGQPVVSRSLAVTSRDGLSVQELLASIEALSAILSRTKPPAGPEQSAVPVV